MRLFIISRRGDTKSGLCKSFVVAAVSREQAYRVAMLYNCNTEGATTDKWMIQECDGEWDGPVTMPRTGLSDIGGGVLLCQKKL